MKLDIILDRLLALTTTPSSPKSPLFHSHVNHMDRQIVETMKSPLTDESRRSPMVSATTMAPMEQQSTKTMPTLPPMAASHLPPWWPPQSPLQPVKPTIHHQPPLHYYYPPQALFPSLPCSLLFNAYYDTTTVRHLFDGWVANA